MTATEHATGTTRAVGARINRVEDPRLLTGRGTFVDDIQLPGMLHAYFVRSPVAHARITGIDTSAALAVPGVHAVLTAADLDPHVREQWHTAVGKASPDTPRPPLANDKVRFVGDPVALVLADTRYIAEDAGELVEVDYEQLPAVIDYLTAGENETLVHEAHGSNVIGEMAGLPAAMLADDYANAAHVISESIYQQAHCAVPMECRALLADYRPTTGEYTLYAATQAPHEWRAFCARLTGVPEHQVRVIMRDTGGGFGQKVIVQRDDMVIMLAGYLVGRPIKWAEDRRENLLAAGKSRRESADLTMAFDAEGRIVAEQIDFVQDSGAYPSPWPVSTAAAVCVIFPGPYRVPAGKCAFTVKTVYTNTSGRTAYRGPWMFETLAREVMLDISAREMGMDPAELRRRNLLRSDELPYTNPNGMPYNAITPMETFEQALEILDYDAFRAEQKAAREQGRYIGVGISSYVEPSAPGFGSYGSEAATIRIEPSGKVNVYIAGGSTGNSIETTVIQLTADALGCDVNDVSTIQGDTAVTGFGAGAAGSRSGSMTAGAINETAKVLRERLVALAAHKLEAAPADIELSNSTAAVAGDPTTAITFAELAAAAYYDPMSLPPGIPAGLEHTARYTSAAATIFVNATHVCTCEVDVKTGQVKLLRYIVSEDCGPMINPNVVEGQIAGGVVQGIGGALLEHLAYDDEGNPIATTFMDYLLPTATEVPVIEYGHIETPSPGPGGFKGVGEGGAIGAPPAVVNAVADALSPFNVRLTRTPLTPEYLLAQIQGP
ncbi:MAG TPA: xanthine dehydrogenase family protein molybdopterin-binding subunit [Mycobacteriales bacterium]|nr:xanthine dehydrogenase family protein molybdopterin-binding subunit [Mycobacteriales bacterium]